MKNNSPKQPIQIKSLFNMEFWAKIKKSIFKLKIVNFYNISLLRYKLLPENHFGKKNWVTKFIS